MTTHHAGPRSLSRPRSRTRIVLAILGAMVIAPLLTSGTHTASVPVAGGGGGAGSPAFKLVYQTDFSKPDPAHWNPTDAPDGRHHWIASQLSYGSQGLLIRVSQAKLGAGDATWYGGALNSTISERYGMVSVTSSCSAGLTKCVSLLWPDAKVWPPEVDFQELFGASNPTRNGDQLTDHFGPDGQNHQIVQHAAGDYTQLHTISVQWTPSTLTYLLDGRVVAFVKNSLSASGAPTVPQIPMHLVINSIEQVDGTLVAPNHPTTFRITEVRIYSYVP